MATLAAAPLVGLCPRQRCGEPRIPGSKETHRAQGPQQTQKAGCSRVHSSSKPVVSHFGDIWMHPTQQVSTRRLGLKEHHGRVHHPSQTKPAGCGGATPTPSPPLGPWGAGGHGADSFTGTSTSKAKQWVSLSYGVGRGNGVWAGLHGGVHFVKMHQLVRF